MKIYTIGKCGDCPAYIPNPLDYTDDGVCRRNHEMKVWENTKPPVTCPLKEFREEWRI